MSHLKIQDGTGAGFLAAVDSSHRLHTVAVAEAESKVHAKEGNAYSFTSPNYAVAANTNTLVWWMLFDDPVRKFYVNTIFVGWNGGDTTGSKTLEAALHTGVPEPTAGHTAATMRNLNFTSANVSLTRGYTWNGVQAGGMTAQHSGLQLNALKFAPGTTHLPINGTMILGKGFSLATYLKAPEAGMYCGILSGWFE